METVPKGGECQSHSPLGRGRAFYFIREHLLALAAVKIPLEHSPELLVSERGGGN